MDSLKITVIKNHFQLLAFNLFLASSAIDLRAILPDRVLGNAFIDAVK